MRIRSYGDADHYKVVTAYVLSGTLRAAARDTGIPFETIQGWKKQKWWGEILSKLRQENEDLYVARYHDLVTIGTEKIKERMLEGDPYIANGKVLFKPCSLRDICGATMYIFDRLKVLRNLQPEKLDEKLDPMHDSFAEFKKLAADLQEKNKTISNSVATEVPFFDLSPLKAVLDVHN